MEVISDYIDKVTDESATQNAPVSKVIQAKLNSLLTEMIENCDDITGAMVSSSDGHAWAERLPGELDQHRFAAMSSALLALGDTMLKETMEARPKNVFLESDEGRIFVMHAGNNLLLTIFTSASAQIGMPMAYAKKTSEEISQLSQSVFAPHPG